MLGRGDPIFFRGIRVPAVVVRKLSSAVMRQAASGSFGCAQDDSVELKWSEEGRSRFLDRFSEARCGAWL
jgi:hypothetical protein